MKPFFRINATITWVFAAYCLSFWRVFIQEQQLVIKVRTKTFPFWCQLTCLAFLLRSQMNWGLKIYRRAYKTQWFEKKTAES